MRLQGQFFDMVGLELRRAKIQGLSSDPTLASGDAGRVWYDTANTVFKGWNGTSVDRLTNLIESVTGSGALKATTASKGVSLSVDPASGSGPGTMTAAHFNLLSAAASANNASALVQRDASGNFSAGTISANLSGTATSANNLGGATLAQVRDFSQTNGQRNALSAIADFMTQVVTARLDQFAAPTAPVAFGSQRLTGVADPTNPQDVSTKNYVDSVATGLDTKASVKASTTGALPGYNYANGSSGQGATLTASTNGAFPILDTTYTPVAGDRILVKDESGNQAYNGIYVLTQVGSGSAPWILTRASDADTPSEMSPGMFTFIENGQSLRGSGWVLNTSTNPIVIGSTALTFAQFSGGQAYTAGNGLNLAGSAFSVLGTANRISVSAAGVDIASTYVGQNSITTLGTITGGTWNATTIGIAYGGTGATTAAAARSNLGTPGKYAAALPALTAGSGQVVTHGLGTADIVVAVIDTSTNEIVYADITNITSTQLTVTSGLTAAAGALRIVAVG